jgi:uncharacterized protein (TIGR01777 family)
MRILITGSHGLIGSAVCGHFESGGHQVIPLSRTHGASPWWDPARGLIDLSGVGKLDAVIHLAGENVASGRWTADKKQRIRDSRVQGTLLLCDALAGLPTLPKVLISASAVGYYGNCPATTVTEKNGPGNGFLADVCHEWEAATETADEIGIRVVHIRTGLVLSAAGGPLSRMLLPFKLGLGGVLGDGNQYLSWIDIRDEVAAIAFLMEQETISGPVNLTAPQPVQNREFTKMLGTTLRRPTIFPMPRFLCKFLFGEMGETLLLGGVRALPKKLEENGFVFRFPNLKKSLDDLI